MNQDLDGGSTHERSGQQDSTNLDEGKKRRSSIVVHGRRTVIVSA
jgi:hypothetical protein